MDFDTIEINLVYQSFLCLIYNDLFHKNALSSRTSKISDSGDKTDNFY